MSTQKRGYRPSCEWYTPPVVYKAIETFFGTGIDLDPCANPEKTIPARKHLLTNGLDATWSGKVYVNPPYAPKIQPWIEKALSDPIDEIILLLPARTDTAYFQMCFAYTICFISGRLQFWHPNLTASDAAFPSAFVYRGPRPMAFAEQFRTWGHVVIGRLSAEPLCPTQLPLGMGI